MSGIDFIFAAENAPFTIAATVMLMIGGLELLSLLVGHSLSGMVDHFMPDALSGDLSVDLDLHTDIHTDIDLNVHPDAHMPFAVEFLNWFYIGKMPFLMVLVIFMMSFSTTGYLMNEIMFSITEHRLSTGLGSLIAFLLCLFPMHFLSAIIYTIMPKDESEAISVDDLIDRTGEILYGKLPQKAGESVEIKIEVPIDHNTGKTQNHFIVAQLTKDTEYTGRQVVITGRNPSTGIYTFKYR